MLLGQYIHTSLSCVLIVVFHGCVFGCREMAHVRRLSRGLLDQRTELESFFISALAQVKKEIAANRHVSMFSCNIVADGNQQ